MLGDEDDNWIATIARILCAQTADLRELALIAKGDPRTFYIGTSLDGVDLRGQDLRGMLLPNLDLAKVRLDDATRLDDTDQNSLQVTEILKDNPEEFIAAALVYVASPRLWEMLSRGGPFIDGVEFFSPETILSFKSQAIDFQGPKFILFDDDEFLVIKLPQLAKDIISLIYTRNHRSINEITQLSRSDYSEIRVLVPQLKEIGQSRGGEAMRLPTGLRDAIEFFSTDWPTLSHFSQSNPVTIFFSARKIPTVRHPWLQIYSWAVQFGVEFCSGALISPRSSSISGDFRFVSALFGGSIPPNRIITLKSPFSAAALFDFSSRARSKNGEIHSRIPHLLEILGWNVVREIGPRDLIDLRVEGGSGAFNFELKHAIGSESRIFYPEELSQVELFPTMRIVVNEPADTASVVAQMISGTLLLSARDLADFDDPVHSTFWSLVGSNALRCARAGDPVQRLQYIAILIHNAARHSPQSERKTELLRWIQEPHFLKNCQLRTISASREGLNFVLRLEIRRSRWPEPARSINFYLVIRPVGPILA